MAVDRTDLSGRPDTDGYKLALGEFGDAWPESIREAIERGDLADDELLKRSREDEPKNNSEKS